MTELAVTLGGERWLLRLVNRRQMPSRTWGDCNRATKVIRVRYDLSDRNFLDTLIHELRHAQHPIMFEAEEFITDTSTEIAAVLTAVGVKVPGIT